MVESKPSYRGASELLQDIIADQQSSGVTVCDTDGVVLFSSWAKKGDNWSEYPEIVTAKKREIGQVVRTHNDKNTAFLATPVVVNQEIIGFLVLNKPSQDVAFKTGQLFRFIIGTFLIAMLLGSLLIYTSTKIETEPLLSLIDSAKKISLGDLDTRFESTKKDEIGQLARVLQTMVSRLKKALRDVNDERTRFQAMFTNMLDGLIFITKDKVVFMINPVAVNMLGSSKYKIQGYHIDKANLPKEITQKILETEPGVESEITIGTTSKRFARIRKANIEIDEDFVGTLVILEDITRIKNLEQSEQEFTQYISHELKTPLTSITASIETIQTSAKNDPKAQEKFLANIKSDVERLTKLVQSLLAYQRIKDNGEQISKFGAVELLMDVHSKFLAYATKKIVYLDFDIPEDEVYVQADKERILQVLVNLVDNAIRYTPERGHVTIGFEQNQAWRKVKFYVSDTGIGIPKEFLSRIGERFIKIPRKDHKFDTQVGLGISICKEIVKRHGSSLEVESVEGKGTKFSFYIRKAES
jgi:two-component system phosphate regulon sensor histidine kinase PhoR